MHKKGVDKLIRYLGKTLYKDYKIQREELIDMEIGDTISKSKFNIKVDNISEEKVYINERLDSLTDIISLVENVDRIVDEGVPMKVAYLERLLKRI